MGRNNKQRRAAKKGQRAAAAEDRRRDGRGGRSLPPSVADLVRTALRAYGAGGGHYEQVVGELCVRGDEAVRVIGGLTAAALDALWDQGWTPADVVHVVGRHLSVRHADAAADAVIADGWRQLREGLTLHPRWQAQISALEAQRDRLSIAAVSEPAVALEVLCVLSRLVPVTRTIPRPAAGAQFDIAPGPELDRRMLARVRALLAKAESTEFDEEAEALTAKAQELIARHAITEALIHATDDLGEPSARRILLDNPYADAKASLVTEVSAANRCRAVHLADYGWATVFGFDPDLDAVELLTASLMVQATGFMARHGPRRDARGRSTTRSFRRAFLFGFARRIGQRLREANDQQMTATAESDQQRLLPVLSARDDRVRDAQFAAFPNTVLRQRSISNGGGWVAGQAAADLVDLTVSAGAVGPTGA